MPAVLTAESQVRASSVRRLSVGSCDPDLPITSVGRKLHYDCGATQGTARCCPGRTRTADYLHAKINSVNSEVIDPSGFQLWVASCVLETLVPENLPNGPVSWSSLARRVGKSATQTFRKRGKRGNVFCSGSNGDGSTPGLTIIDIRRNPTYEQQSKFLGPIESSAGFRQLSATYMQLSEVPENV